MSEAYEQVLELIPELTASEAKDIKARLTYAGKQSVTGKQDREDTDVELFYSAIHQEFERRGLEIPNWFMFKKTDNISYLRKNVQANKEFFNKHLPTRRPERLHAFKIISRLMVDWLQKIGLTVTPGVLVRNLSNVQFVIEDNFPGYIESGLLHLAMKPKKG